MATPSRDHRCLGLTPPTPQPVEKQRRHCLSEAHVECGIYRAALDVRASTLAGGAETGRIEAADRARRPVPRTAPILLERPRLVDQAARLQLDRAPGQLALVALMIVAFAIVALSRFSGGDATPTASASNGAVVPSASLIAVTAVPSVAASTEPSAAASPAPSASGPAPSPAYRTTYTVKKGDTLIAVASRYQTTAAAIRRLNNLTTSTLHIGQVLKIP